MPLSKKALCYAVGEMTLDTIVIGSVAWRGEMPWDLFFVGFFLIHSLGRRLVVFVVSSFRLLINFGKLFELFVQFSEGR
ncbi:hypothetical protein [Cytobacillus firmus]|uniref:hypothetical protein n=1 Tax=Cytobacillus firmus TaxID=1399 RepID=UPI001C95A2DE|nr:hypothetical protein [Cytobacillus firmus]MBY6052621.1 hypothetical protein [Cytobacillus firmus]